MAARVDPPKKCDGQPHVTYIEDPQRACWCGALMPDDAVAVKYSPAYGTLSWWGPCPATTPRHRGPGHWTCTLNTHNGPHHQHTTPDGRIKAAWTDT